MFPVAFQLLLVVSLLCLMTLGTFMSSGPNHCSVPMASSRKHCSSSRVKRVCQSGKRTPKTVRHYPYGMKAERCATQRLPFVIPSKDRKFDFLSFWLLYPSHSMFLYLVGVQLVWQQTNQVQEEHRQISRGGQSLCCENSRDSCTCGGCSRAEQPDQLTHHTELWWVWHVYSARQASATVPHPIDWSHSLTEHTVELKGRLVFTCGDVPCWCSLFTGAPAPGRFWNLYT